MAITFEKIKAASASAILQNKYRLLLLPPVHGNNSGTKANAKVTPAATTLSAASAHHKLSVPFWIMYTQLSHKQLTSVYCNKARAMNSVSFSYIML